MALYKEIKTKSGVPVSYWKITDWKINQNAKSVDMILTPYLNQNTRENGYEPLRDEVRKIRATDYFISEGNSMNRTDYTDYFSPTALEKAASDGKSIYQVMYDYIKLKNKDFTESEDI